MKVIVSNVLEDHFANFVLVDNFKRVRELQGVDTLIIHKFKESSFDAGVFISSFHNDGIETFVYICDSPLQAVKSAIIGVGGVCYEDEFYFEDEEELMALLEGIEDEKETQLAASKAPIKVIKGFVEAYTNGDESVNSPVVLDSVRDSIRELSEIVRSQDIQLVAMGASAVETYEKASQIITKMNERNAAIAEKLRDLENGLASSSSKATFSNSVMFFAPYTYRSNPKLLLIREYAPCRYLTSFVLGYLHHLHYELNKRPKLIFVVQKGAGVASKYTEWPMITADNTGLTSLYVKEIVATNNPKKEVMKELLSTPNDVFVVVDRLYGNVDIVSGRVTRVNALGSRSDISRYQVRPEDSIFSVTSQPKQLFTIPVIKSFPQETDARYATYAQVMGEKYGILDMKLGLKVGE